MEVDCRIPELPYNGKIWRVYYFGDISQNAVFLNLADFKFGNSVHVYNYTCWSWSLILAVYNLVFFLFHQTANLKTPPIFPLCHRRLA